MNAARTARTLSLPLALVVALAGCAMPEETGGNETDDTGMDGRDTGVTTGNDTATDGTGTGDNATDEAGPSEDTTDAPPLGDDTIGSTDCPPSAYAGGNNTANDTTQENATPVGDADVCPRGSTLDEA